MKKLISMILAVLMTGLCACGTAEDAGQDIPFLRIREGVSGIVSEAAPLSGMRTGATAAVS